jgi:hypothetical protein
MHTHIPFSAQISRQLTLEPNAIHPRSTPRPFPNLIPKEAGKGEYVSFEKTLPFQYEFKRLVKPT